MRVRGSSRSYDVRPPRAALRGAAAGTSVRLSAGAIARATARATAGVTVWVTVWATVWGVAVAGPATAAGAEPNDGQPVGTNQVVSVKPTGKVPERSSSNEASVSADGRYVAFVSTLKNMVPGLEDNHRRHVYLRDRETGVTIAIDVRADGMLGDGVSYEPSVSGDGRYVVFASKARNLVPAGSKRYTDVFLRDTVSGTTTQLSLTSDGDRAHGWSRSAQISADASTVIFVSAASNLVPGQTPQQYTAHLYRHDLTTGETTLVSKTPTGEFPDAGSYGGSLSADGRLIAYSSGATDIVPGATTMGNVVLFDVDADTSLLVSRPPGGKKANGGSGDPAISADGTVIVFSADASNLVADDRNDTVDIFAYAVPAGATTMVSRSRSGRSTDGYSFDPDVDADGSHITFDSAARNLVADDDGRHNDVFLYAAATGDTTLISRSQRGHPADNDSRQATISDDGSVLAYVSLADDLVPQSREQEVRVYAYRIS